VDPGGPPFPPSYAEPEHFRNGSKADPAPLQMDGMDVVTTVFGPMNRHEYKGATGYAGY